MNKVEPKDWHSVRLQKTETESGIYFDVHILLIKCIKRGVCSWMHPVSYCSDGTVPSLQYETGCIQERRHGTSLSKWTGAGVSLWVVFCVPRSRYHLWSSFNNQSLFVCLLTHGARSFFCDRAKCPEQPAWLLEKSVAVCWRFNSLIWKLSCLLIILKSTLYSALETFAPMCYTKLIWFYAPSPGNTRIPRKSYIANN